MKPVSGQWLVVGGKGFFLSPISPLLFPVILLIALLVAFATAQSDIVSVPSTQNLTAEQERSVERIGMKLHCPICSGESIVQSQADISRQMLNQVREMVKQGKPESEILQTFVNGYGERILMEPPRRGITSLLWTLPIAFLVLGGVLWWGYLQRASRAVTPEALSAEDERRIDDLLAERK